MTDKLIPYTLPDGTEVFVDDIGQFDEDGEDDNYSLTKYGCMRRRFLEEADPNVFERMGLVLISHCKDVEREAIALQEQLFEQMKKDEGLTEEYKRKDWIGYVRKQENLLNRIDEIVIKEVIEAAEVPEELKSTMAAG